MANNFKKFLLGLADYLLAFVALYLVLLIRYPLEGFSFFVSHAVIFWKLFLVWLLSFYSWDFYSLTGRWNFKNFGFANMINLGLGFAFFYLWPELEITPKTNMLLLIGVYMILVYLWRLLISQVFKMAKGRGILLIGADSHAINLALRLKKSPKLGFEVKGIVARPEDIFPEELKDIKTLTDPEMIGALVKEQGISTVVVSDQWYHQLSKSFYGLIPSGVTFYHIATFFDEFLDLIPIYAANEIWFLEHLRNIEGRFYGVLKRTIDLLSAVVILPLLLVLGLITAFLVKISSKGPVFYTQNRVGLKGKIFKIYKFRSMYIDAEARGGAQWSTKNDPRITPVGRFLRGTRLDEIPQILNVLKGEMSFVGPRPERPEFVEMLEKEIPHYQLRHLVRPGLTGWAQILFPYGSSVEDSARKLEYDLYYLKNKGILLDAKIALKTIKVVLSKMGR